MSTITKRALAQSLSELLSTRQLENITVKDITDKCGLSRNTFYYHFCDIYDLLEWMFNAGADLELASYEEKEDWRGAYKAVLDFMYNNRNMIKNIYRSMSSEMLHTFVSNIVVKHAVNQVSIRCADLDVGEEAIKMISTFMSNAACGSVFAWIKEGMNESPDKLADLMEVIADATLESSVLALQEWIDERDSAK